MAYSTDLKLRVIAYVEEGHTLAQKAAIFKVHPWSIIHWRKKYKATGNVENKVRRPVNKKIIPEKLLEYVKEHPDAYLKEIAELFGCCPSSVLKRLRKLRHHTKKNSTFYKEQDKQKIEHYNDLLQQLTPGSVLIMDNASFHRKDVLYEIIKKYPHTLIFLPPYSPEYNPIEHTWSALKRNVASCVHLYGSVSEALDVVLKGN